MSVLPLPSLRSPGPDGFQPLFMQSRGQPISYGGRNLVMMDRFPLHGCRAVRISRLSTNSEWKQGIRIDASSEISAGGIASRALLLWEDTAPGSTTVDLPEGLNEIEVRNVWDTGDGVTQSWHFGAAMIVADTPHGRRYACNDGHPDADFDDIVFLVERLPLAANASN